jgi:hypothetical protein
VLLDLSGLIFIFRWGGIGLSRLAEPGQVADGREEQPAFDAKRLLTIVLLDHGSAKALLEPVDAQRADIARPGILAFPIRAVPGLCSARQCRCGR